MKNEIVFHNIEPVYDQDSEILILFLWASSESFLESSFKYTG